MDRMEVLDRLGRPLTSLRLSVTDRCNLRCHYCMPEQDYVWLPRGDILTFEEIDTLVDVFTDVGVDRVRITGGEPLLRKNLPNLIALLARKTAIEDLALTTNGMLLADQVEALRAAGLPRITVSLDTLHTDRFKAISSGAGTMNWISMYAQSDVQRNRRFYVGDDLLYDNFDMYWDQSPLKYIKNAKTPTMIHVVQGDPRVPSPQSVELHMALKKLEVPTELFMYPGQSHGIPDPRNRLLKAVSEMAWMDYYVRDMGEKFQWRDVLQTLPEKTEESELH